VETGAHSWVGWDAGDAAHKMAEMMREAVTPQTAIAFYTAMRDVDCSPLLADLSAPTLLIHPRQFPLISVELVQNLAASIPDARLLMVDGASMAPTRCDLDAVCLAMQDFLAENEGQAVLEDSTIRRVVSPAADAADLSAREVEVLGLLAQGCSNRDIAELLVLSVRTVERHVENIYAKIKVNGRAQATAYALRHNLL
jgi:DNA-binding NarL/FixJ family response regulator